MSCPCGTWHLQRLPDQLGITKITKTHKKADRPSERFDVRGYDSANHTKITKSAAQITEKQQKSPAVSQAARRCQICALQIIKKHRKSLKST